MLQRIALVGNEIKLIGRVCYVFYVADRVKCEKMALLEQNFASFQSPRHNHHDEVKIDFFILL